MQAVPALMTCQASCMLITRLRPLGDCWLQPERQASALLTCPGYLHYACLLCVGTLL